MLFMRIYKFVLTWLTKKLPGVAPFEGGMKLATQNLSQINLKLIIQYDLEIGFEIRDVRKNETHATFKAPRARKDEI